MKVEFLSPLRVENVGKDRWRVFGEFRAQVDEETCAGPYPCASCSRLVVVPEGYETDFASVPRLPFAYLVAGGRAPKSATLHDFLYSIRAGREYADDVFLAAMKAEGVGPIIRRLMYLAVRLGGGSRYEEAAAS